MIGVRSSLTKEAFDILLYDAFIAFPMILASVPRDVGFVPFVITV